ncbi:hydroxymethylglutaryl-CoA reductase [Aspergillus melleus]|uniref:hydroxymethylglutaryl-CoA reductase n=1 Tax=Aspergillus melleus TaxID=138277 RepID=UPI001E8EC07C|nr:uncharacterized protein LDX57_007171 [Aspergillus melleus]KAH8429509.1 hypothetical protein LDX57_007171 [Aspergillus melleus]
MAPPSQRSAAKFQPHISGIEHITNHDKDPEAIQIENFIGFTRVPLGLAGPLHIRTPEGDEKDVCAPMATTEAAMIASCCRGCKAFNMCGGAEFHVLSQGMSRAPAFQFDSPREACLFSQRIRDFESDIAKVAESTSRYVQFRGIVPHVIGSWTHVVFRYVCGDAAGQNMVSFATETACAWLMKSTFASEFQIRDFCEEGQMSSEKKASWGHVTTSRGVEVIAWGKLSDAVCRSVFKCSTERLHQIMRIGQEGNFRNGQHGHNIDVANVLAAIFIATGQDAACVTDASWSQLTMEYDQASRDLRLSLYFPSLPVGVIGGGTCYDTQQEGLQIIQCAGPGLKEQFAGFIACFALALDLSTAASVATNTFAGSHAKMAHGRSDHRQRAKM